MDAALTERQDMSAERAQREFVLHWELAAMFGGLCSYMVGKTWNESAGCAQHTYSTCTCHERVVVVVATRLFACDPHRRVLSVRELGWSRVWFSNYKSENPLQFAVISTSIGIVFVLLEAAGAKNGIFF
jgi:hypothetical protein